MNCIVAIILLGYLGFMLDGWHVVIIIIDRLGFNIIGLRVATVNLFVVVKAAKELKYF